MPLYDFHCDECGTDVELLVRFSDAPTCPKCGAAGLKRAAVSGVSPPGKSKEIVKSWRAQAKREGHFSNY